MSSALDALPPLSMCRAVREAERIVDFELVLVNRAMAEALGEPVVGRRLIELYPRLEEIGHFDALVRVVETGDTWSDSLAWFEDRGTAGFWEVEAHAAGDGFVLTGTDVTELRLAAATLEQVPEAVLAVGAGGIVTYWGPGAERLYGWTSTEMAGQNISLIKPPGHEALSDFTAAALRGECVAPFEAERIHKDGRTLWVEITLAPVFDRSGRVVRITSIHRDRSHAAGPALSLLLAKGESDGADSTLLECSDCTAQWRLTDSLCVDELSALMERRSTHRCASGVTRRAVTRVRRFALDAADGLEGLALSRDLAGPDPHGSPAVHHLDALADELAARSGRAGPAWFPRRAPPGRAGRRAGSSIRLRRGPAAHGVPRRAGVPGGAVGAPVGTLPGDRASARRARTRGGWRSMNQDRSRS
jgi:PAS domain S-box-containing protein